MFVLSLVDADEERGVDVNDSLPLTAIEYVDVGGFDDKLENGVRCGRRWTPPVIDGAITGVREGINCSNEGRSWVM